MAAAEAVVVEAEVADLQAEAAEEAEEEEEEAAQLLRPRCRERPRVGLGQGLPLAF